MAALGDRGTEAAVRSVAVCVCTCDRPAPLARLLAALERVEPVPESVRIYLIIVDNRPDGRARVICATFAPRLPMPLHLVEEQREGVSFARNRAVAEALAQGAEFVAFLDDDDAPHADWLDHLLRRQAETGADLVFGAWCPPAKSAAPGWLRHGRYLRPPNPSDRNRYGLPGWAGTYNVLIARRVLERLADADGPFRARFAHCGGEDLDLFIRAQALGFSHATAPRSLVERVWEQDRLTIRGMLRRGFLAGGARAQLARAHLPTAEVRALARSSARKLAKSLLRLPLSRGRSDLVDRLVVLAQAAGELHAWTGQRSSYYLRRSG